MGSFKGFARAEGDKESLQKIFRRFMTSVPDQIEILYSTIESWDANAVIKQALLAKEHPGIAGVDRNEKGYIVIDC